MYMVGCGGLALVNRVWAGFGLGTYLSQGVRGYVCLVGLQVDVRG